jgi:hypothetical protein
MPVTRSVDLATTAVCPHTDTVRITCRRFLYNYTSAAWNFRSWSKIIEQ